MGIPTWVIVLVGVVVITTIGIGVYHHYASSSSSSPPQQGDDSGSTSKFFEPTTLPKYRFTVHYDCKAPAIPPTVSNIEDANLQKFKPQITRTDSVCTPPVGKCKDNKGTQVVWQVSVSYDKYNALINSSEPKQITTDLGVIACACECVTGPKASGNCDGEGRHPAGSCVDPSSQH
jgi:hypothetical protein